MGVRKILEYLFVLGPAMTTYAAPISETVPIYKIERRQAAAAPALTDVDILQFALTAEHLENAFYSQGFAKFKAADFKALGLSDASITALLSVGQQEATHVSTLLSAVAGAGTIPVEPCKYDFGFTDAAGMVATARVLEAVGVSAYLGAAPLIADPAILSAAASIVTIESRHQTFIRAAAGATPIPTAFDAALGPRAVFTLASQFIVSCNAGSNLNLQAFPPITLANAAAALPGKNLVVQDNSMPATGAFCAFIGAGVPQFSELTNGQCVVPQTLAGEVYMMVTSSQSVDDSAVIAGPSVLQPS